MEPVTKRRWRLREADPEVVTRLVRECSLSHQVARLLVNRGIHEAPAASAFISSAMSGLHDPFLLLGMDEAVARLVVALSREERVCVYGDYDVDGITSVALLVDFFRAVGLDVFYHIPRRMEDGYGLSPDGIERVAALGAKVVITVDCGITALGEALLCTAHGIDLIITDHHMPGETLPRALAVINPLQPGCTFPFKYPAGVGLAFNLLIAFRSRLRSLGHFHGKTEPNLRQYLDLVALGTVADIVPLVDENRIFVKYGLMELTSSARVGVRALKKVSGVDGDVGCGAVGFRLAPRLNAAGRLEDAAPGVELLLTGDTSRAEALATELDAGNAERQEIEQEILRDVLEKVKGSNTLKGRKSIVLASEAWHPGVIGIVASRIVDLYHRPTILIAMKDGNGRGSGRSIAKFHLHDALQACSEHLLKFGGHKHAAGLSIEEATLEAFVASFDAVAEGVLTPEDLLPELAIDGELSPHEMTLDLVDLVEALAPFGMGNPEPVFMLSGAKVLERRILKEKHLKLRLEAGGQLFEAIGFNMAEKPVSERVDLAFNLQVNDWNGRRTLQLRLKDMREAVDG